MGWREERDAEREAKRAKRVEERKKRWAEEEREKKEHAARLEEEHGYEWLSEKARAAIYKYAWDEGHSSGFSEVEVYYSRLSEMLDPILDEFKKDS